MDFKRRSWIVLMLQFSIVPLFAQDLNEGFFPVDFEELSGKSVSCVIKDHWGFMWFGTSEGLCRFDGTNVKIYKHNTRDSTSLSHNEVNVLMEDADHTLWVGTSNGLNRYDRYHDNFVDVDDLPGNTNRPTNHFITALACDSVGQVWIGTWGGGLNIYNTKTFRYTYYLTGDSKDHYVAAGYVNGIVIHRRKAWIATRAGLKVFDVRNLRAETLTVDGKILRKEITSMVSRKNGDLLLGFADGDIQELVLSGQPEAVKPYASIATVAGPERLVRKMSLDAAGDLWVVTEKSGLVVIRSENGELAQFIPEEGNPHSAPAFSLRTVYGDDEGRIWVGTYNMGVYAIDRHARKFELYRRNPLRAGSLLDNNVRAFAEDADGNVWIAGNGGVNTLDMKTRQVTSPRHINDVVGNKVIKDVIVDSQNNLWLGTRDDGVVRVGLQTGKVSSFDLVSPGTGNNKVLCLYEDKKKNIWAGTLGSGLFYFDRRANKFVLRSDKDEVDYVSERAYVTSIVEDSDSAIWVGTLDGLFALRRKKDNTFSYKAYYQHQQEINLSSSRVMELYEDHTGTMWVGTFDNGLNKFIREKDVFESYSEENGLINNSIKGIIADSKGYIWISSSAGISKFHPAYKSLKHYTKDDGLNSNLFNPGSRLALRSGHFIFGGDNGFNIFHPDSIRDNLAAPVMYLTGLRVNNRPAPIGHKDSPLSQHISLTKTVALSYEQRSFAIDFVALGFGPSAKNQYCYKLEGFEDSWNCIGTDHTATYTNIDPGHYVFLVKGSNSDGVWCVDPARLEIIVYPPLWKTWWAMCLYTGVFFGLTYLVLRIRTERISIKNQLKLEKMAREKEHELTQSKMHFFTNISHELRTPLTLILMPLEKVATSSGIPDKLKSSLSTAYMNCAKLMKLVNELMDLSKFEEVKPTLSVQSGEVVRFITGIASTFNDIAEKKNIRMTLVASPPEIHGWCDQDKLEKILRNLLSNAFKFTRDQGEISVTINALSPDGSTQRQLSVKVTDNGIGITPDELPRIFDKFFQARSTTNIPHPGTGIGLALTKTLIDVHRGNISVQSTLGEGTTFTITLPIDKSAFREDEIQVVPDIIRDETNGAMSEYDNVIIDQGLGKPELLIVEDNDELRQFLVAEFSVDFSVTEAADGNEGFRLACEKVPDLIVSDIVLPGKTGLALCRETKADLRTSHIPVILLTAKSSTEDQVVGLESGADIYMPKPFSLRVLRAHVKQVITARKKLYARYSQEAFLLPESLADNAVDKEFLQKAVDYIEKNLLNAQLSVESMAELFNISRSQVYRKIKAITGQTVVEFIRTIRLKHALRLMEERKYTLSEIAYQTGFNSLSYFTRSFKDQYGKAPSEFVAGAK